MSIVFFLIVFALLVLSHEFGHFIVAKKSGIRVDEFGFGFPPRLLKFQKGETVYSLNLIPFGGFVKIYGEDGETSGDSRSFASKSICVRAAVISAGVIFNLILAWILVSGGFIVGLPASVSSASSGASVSDSKIAVIYVAPDSPAESAGLQAGDELIGFSEIESIQKFISDNKGREVKLDYARGGEFFSAKLTPRTEYPSDQGAIGIAMDKIGIVKLPWHQAALEGLKTVFQVFYAIIVTIFDFIVGAFMGTRELGEMMGPVGIVSVTGAAAKLGFVYLLNFVAFFSINLAVINIIPFPALDGGRLLFLLVEKIKGSPVSARITGIAHGIGLALLLLLMLAITYNDILRLI